MTVNPNLLKSLKVKKRESDGLPAAGFLFLPARLILSRFDDYSDCAPIADKLPHDLTTI